MGTRPEVAQIRGGGQIVEKLRVALQLSEVIRVQDHRLNVLRAVALDHECLARLRLRKADVIALDRRTMQGHTRKIATLSDGTSSESYDISFTPILRTTRADLAISSVF